MPYHRLSVLSILATATLASPATPLAPPWDDILVKHAWDAVPAKWKSLGSPPPDTTIDLHIALTPHKENALIDALYEVSSPGNPKYGAHLSKEEVAKLVAPHPNTLELVHSWLAHHDIPSSSISTTHGGGWLALTGVPVSQANGLLGASYQLYQHAETNDSTILRTVKYALPKVLHTHVQTVVPTTYFASMRTLQQTLRGPSFRSAGAPVKVGSREHVTVMSSRDIPMVTPEFLRWQYGTIEYKPAATDQNALGIVGSLGDYPSPSDLMMFMDLYRDDALDATFTVELANDGQYDPTHPGVEGNLIMQYAQAIAYPTSHILYSAGGESHWTVPGNKPAPDDVISAWFNYVLAQEKIPQTITLMYAHAEKDVPLEYARAVCELFAHLGVRGVSVVVATGNKGVGAGDCKANDRSKKVQFETLFPSTCPWVTSVGGTTSELPEVAASISGGGFSNYFSRPSYQSEAVPNYLHRLGAQHYGLYNAAGRGIPDVAAQAINFQSITGIYILPANGTGCAVPVVAGIISLLNDFLLSKRMPPLGFLNPWLYSDDGLSGIDDIRSGSNPGCGTDGFPAIPGWDPVTGLGTPNFEDLMETLDEAISSMPTPTPTPTPTHIPYWYTPTPLPTPRL